MSVNIGMVNTFPNVKPDKAQVMKIAEETLEVFSAWEVWVRHPATYTDMSSFMREKYCRNRLLDECADVIQATSNLIAALGVEDFTPYMQACKERNLERGRL